MFVAIGRFEIFIEHATSLKDKRRVLRSVVQTIRKRFNAAVSEVDFQDKWQRAALGVSCVSESSDHARQMIDEIDRHISSIAAGEAEVTLRDVIVVSRDDL